MSTQEDEAFESLLEMREKNFESAGTRFVFRQELRR